MTCTFSKESLALYAEGDLHDQAAEAVRQHVSTCAACERYLDEMQTSQARLKALRADVVSQSARAGMRQAVMSTINERRDLIGWRLRLERALLLGWQPGAYAMAAAVIIGVVSVSLLGQVRHRPMDVSLAAARDNSLHRPEGYRDWVELESKASAAADRVYLNPAGSKEYAKSGTFPEGTMLVLEPGSENNAAARAHKGNKRLLVSVKDSRRFEGGWGFFQFDDADGPGGNDATASEAEGCRTCHRDNAATDHVFTQSYQAVRSARAVAPGVQHDRG